MTIQEINGINREITKFIQNIAEYEDSIVKSSVDVWMGILASLSTLTKVSVYFEDVKAMETKEELDFFNNLREANGKKKVDTLPDNLVKFISKNEIDLKKYPVTWKTLKTKN